MIAVQEFYQIVTIIILQSKISILVNHLGRKIPPKFTRVRRGVSNYKPGTFDNYVQMMWIHRTYSQILIPVVYLLQAF